MNKRQVIFFLLAAFMAVGVVSIGSAAYSVYRMEREIVAARDFQIQSLYDIIGIKDNVTEYIQESFSYALSGVNGEIGEFRNLQTDLTQQLRAFRDDAGLTEPGKEAELEIFDRVMAGQVRLSTLAAEMFREVEATGSLSTPTFARYEAATDEIGLALDRLVQIEKADVAAAQAGALGVMDDAQRLVLRHGALILVVVLIAAVIAGRVLNHVFDTREALERQLLQSQKMEAVGQLAGGIAHDFNNYLTVISGAAHLLQQSKGEDVDYWAQQILEAGDRTSALTKQLLAFARKQVLDPQNVDVNSVIESTWPLLRRTIGEDIKLEFVPGDDTQLISADRSQLEQVIVNLVLNARDAMPDGGTVTIESGDTFLSEEFARNHPGVTAGRHTMLAVSDTGTGIDPDIRDRIFEPFVTTKEVGKGTGLGLATVYGIVQQNGGSINVYSEIGQGTTFKLYFRCVESAAATGVAPLPVANIRGEGVVLVVEDDDMVRAVTKTMLEGIGFKVLEAADGTSGLEMVRTHPNLKLLLTDITMPVMGGIELAERARAMQPDLKILYMSGYTQNGIVHHGRVDPGYVLLQKPFTFGELNRKLIEALYADAPRVVAGQ